MPFTVSCFESWCTPYSTVWYWHVESHLTPSNTVMCPDTAKDSCGHGHVTVHSALFVPSHMDRQAPHNSGDATRPQEGLYVGPFWNQQLLQAAGLDQGQVKVTQEIKGEIRAFSVTTHFGWWVINGIIFIHSYLDHWGGKGLFAYDYGDSSCISTSVRKRLKREMFLIQLHSSSALLK